MTVTAETAVKAAVVKGAPPGPSVAAGMLRSAVPSRIAAAKPATMICAGRRENGRAGVRRMSRADPDSPGDQRAATAQTLSSPTVLPPEEPEPAAAAGLSDAFPSPAEAPFEEPSPASEPEPPESSPGPRRLLP